MITKYAVLLAIFGLSISSTTQAQQAEIFSTNGYAIKGYDAVAFFNEGKALKGNDTLVYVHKNTKWVFYSRKNMETFKVDPDKYIPQYGGYCAYGTSQGHKAPTEIDTWTIVNDRLYFNYNQKIKSLWTKDQAQLIQKADNEWPLIKNKD